MTRERASALVKEQSARDRFNQYCVVKYGVRSYGWTTAFSARYNGDKILELWRGGRKEVIG